MISPESRKFIENRRKTPAFGAAGFSLAELRAPTCMGLRAEPKDLPVRWMEVNAGGISAEWVIAADADPNVRLLYLHGGGFVSGSSGFYLRLAARLSMAARCAVLVINYRLAPEHPFPAGLEDCVRGYDWILRTSPTGPAPAKAMFIAGDSAGGGLTLATLLALRDRQRPLPNGAIALSPCADMTMVGESLHSQGQLDPIMHPKCLPEFIKLYLGGADAHDPLASPVFGDYTGIPPLLIHVGEHEIIRDDSLAAAAKARAAGVDATLKVWPGMFHVFHAAEPPLPESRQAIQEIAEFIRSHT